MAVKETDVFVIGGGPAGLAAAIAARQRGLSVTLADGAEPPIDKPCGEGMMPGTQRALRELGVEILAGEGYRFRGIEFVVGNVRLAGGFPEGQGIGIRRPLLHEMLLSEAQRMGVSFLWKSPVRGITAQEVLLSKGSMAARWIIGADGSASRVRRWSDLDAAVQRTQRSATRRHYRVRPWSENMEIHWGQRSQAYVTPISHEEVCIVIMAEKAQDADFDGALGELPELRERLAGAELGSRERGAMTVTHSLRRVTRGNVALIGDASGGVDAITGEGLRLAFRQAQALAEAMLKGDLSRYQRAHGRLARRPLFSGNLMLRLGRDFAFRERAMRAVQRRPGLFARLLAIHAGQSSARETLFASASVSWQFLAA